MFRVAGLFFQAVVIHGKQLFDDWRHCYWLLLPTS